MVPKFSDLQKIKKKNFLKFPDIYFLVKFHNFSSILGKFPDFSSLSKIPDFSLAGKCFPIFPVHVGSLKIFK